MSRSSLQLRKLMAIAGSQGVCAHASCMHARSPRLPLCIARMHDHVQAECCIPCMGECGTICKCLVLGGAWGVQRHA